MIRNREVHTMSLLGPSKNLVPWPCPCSPFISENSDLLCESSRFSTDRGIAPPSKMWPEKSQPGLCAWNKLSVEFFTVDNII